MDPYFIPEIDALDCGAVIPPRHWAIYGDTDDDEELEPIAEVSEELEFDPVTFIRGGKLEDQIIPTISIHTL